MLLAEAQLRALIFRPKPVADPTWRSALKPRSVSADPANRRGSYQFTDPLGDEWLVYSRESVITRGDWSAGLVFDPSGANLRVIRCNGPHPGVHQNRLDAHEPPIVVTPHVHYAREKYLNHRRTQEDGYAVPCSTYSDLAGAIEHLAVVANFVPDGRLIL